MKNKFDIEHVDLDYETTYGHCLAKKPYWFIPDLECNTEKELLNWRHALFAVKQGTFESPEHYYWKTVDTPEGKVVRHGHNSPWGMGISAFSNKVDLWEEHPRYKWLLELAESDVSDEGFLTTIENHNKEQKRKYEEYLKSNASPFERNKEVAK